MKITIEELKALEQAATPGPWKQRELICFGEGQSTTPKFSLTSELNRPYPWENDGKLIVILRNLAPELIALMEIVCTDGWIKTCPEGIKAIKALKLKLEAME